MKILFSCNGLEPGRDGVGDYTRLLAAQCARLGHTCGIIALSDPHLADQSESVFDTGSGKIPCLRLPAAWPWVRRAGLARDFRGRFEPDWISFQVVPYGLGERGIVSEALPALRLLTFGCPVHLMFHELWTGGTGFSHLRRRLIGIIQRRGLRRMISLLRPQLVTTSNPVFVAMLRSIGVTATLLPLFGNVPVTPLASPAGVPARLADSGVPTAGPGRGNWWIAIFFGTIHPEWKPEPLLGILRRAARRAGKRVALLQAGRSGTAGGTIWEKLRQKYRSDFALIQFGEQPVNALSSLLQIADFGIAASPWHLVGKSGTVAAMLDHGLPVIVTRDDFHPRLPLANGPAPDPLLHRCDAALEAKLLAGLTRQPPRARAGEMAARLCDQLFSLSPRHP